MSGCVCFHLINVSQGLLTLALAVGIKIAQPWQTRLYELSYGIGVQPFSARNMLYSPYQDSLNHKMPRADQECTEEGVAAAEGCRENPTNPDEEVPCVTALCQDALHHLPNSPGVLDPVCHLPCAPFGTDWIPR